MKKKAKHTPSRKETPPPTAHGNVDVDTKQEKGLKRTARIATKATLKTSIH